MVQTSLKQLEKMAEASHQTIIVDIPSDTPALLGDERVLIQSLNNLLSNAIKFTPDGGTISVTAHVDANNRIGLAVKGSGIGMSQKGIEKALRPFERAEGAEARRQQGTGLGLHICANFMKMFGGALDIKSTVDIGSTITLQFPAERTIK